MDFPEFLQFLVIFNPIIRMIGVSFVISSPVTLLSILDFGPESNFNATFAHNFYLSFMLELVTSRQGWIFFPLRSNEASTSKDSKRVTSLVAVMIFVAGLVWGKLTLTIAELTNFVTPDSVIDI
jgi:hypothetical protein